MSYSLSAERYTQFIKEKARALGFDFCGISRAEFLENEAPRLEQWLTLQMHGQMGYMANHFDKRLDPRLLVEDSKSVVSLLFNYFPEHDLAQNDNYKISKYAYGADYHFVIRDKLNELLQIIREEIGEVGGRAFVDSAPVMDKAWAQRGGLGWVGKNSNLINKKSGSFFFIAELIIDLELVPDAPIKDYCGTCRKCIDACPTEAIVAPYVVDGSRCISYFTIELKENIPPQMQGKFDDWIFGCDVCQDVCPWNRFSKPHTTPAFAPHQDLAHFTKKDWHELTSETFGKVFGKSALKRTKLSGIQRNVRFVSGETP